MALKNLTGFVFNFALAINSFSSGITHENVKEVFDFLMKAPKTQLDLLESKYKIPTQIDKILYLDGSIFNNQYTQSTLINEVIEHYKTMEFLDKDGNVESNINFIKSLSPRQIIRIYNLRNVYNSIAKELNLETGPYLSVSELNGIYMGRSSIEFTLDSFRSFQKIFFQLNRFQESYVLGYNKSNLPISLSGNGFFRVYQNNYPVYNEDGSSNWYAIQPGSISLSYENFDLEFFEGIQYSKYFPKISYYDEYYYTEKNTSTPGSLIYNNLYESAKKNSVAGSILFKNLKDQMLEINGSFYCSYAFRDPESLIPGTHFILTKQCDLMDPNDCPLN